MSVLDTVLLCLGLYVVFVGAICALVGINAHRTPRCLVCEGKAMSGWRVCRSCWAERTEPTSPLHHFAQIDRARTAGLQSGRPSR